MANPIIVPISGRAGRTEAAGVRWNFDDCEVEFSTVTGEITGFEDQQGDGRTPTNRADGNDDFKGTISGFIDTTAPGGMPSTTFKQGSMLTNLKIFLDKAVIPRFCGSGRVIVRSVRYHPKQTDPAQRITITFENAGGQITHPT